MADNLCGPSNGAKQLVAHADHNRSSHEARYVNGTGRGAAGNTSFRTNTASVNPQDGAFANFQQGPGMMPGAPPVISSPAHHIPGVHQNWPAGPTLGSMQMVPPGVARTDQAPDWVRQFGAMNMNRGPAYTGPAVTMGSTGPVPAQIAPTGPAHTPFIPMGLAYTSGMDARPTASRAAFMPPAQNFNHAAQMRAPGMGQPTFTFPIDSMYDAIDRQSTPTPAIVAVNDSDRLSQASTLVDPSFPTTTFLQDAAQTRANDERDFETAMNSWMGLHAEDGPMQTVTDNLESLAQELETEEREQHQTRDEQLDWRVQQGELAEAASQILGAVAGNTSERFQQSVFLQTMRRIADGSVVAMNNDLVVAETGKSVVVPGEIGVPKNNSSQAREQTST